MRGPCSCWREGADSHWIFRGIRRRGRSGHAPRGQSRGVWNCALRATRAQGRGCQGKSQSPARCVRRPRSGTASRHVGIAVRLGIGDCRARPSPRGGDCLGARRHRQRQGAGMAAAAARLRAPPIGASPRCFEEARMSGFLDEMARLSAARAAQAMAAEPFAALERRAQAAPRGPRLILSAQGFDIIAELKLMSPAAGRLGAQNEDWLKRVTDYAQGGAAAVSVLTEPSRFDGSLEHLQQASAALAPFKVPTMRKDFLVDPYQVLEARAAGAGGVLLIVRMLSRPRMMQLLDTAAEHGLFVLLEAFDADDLYAAREVLTARAQGPAGGAEILVGINSRDLQTLEVVPERFEVLAQRLPGDRPAVAESGVASASDAVRMMRLGFRLALIGTALMSCDDPRQLLREILATTRTVKA